MSIRAQMREMLASRRRARVLARHMSPLVPRDAVVLDVGCGDGLLTQSLLDLRPDLIISAFDVHVRARTHVPVRRFDGRTLPRGNESVDVVILADVLHHADDPIRLLFEAARVARHAIVVKDHVQKGWLDRQALRLLDWAAGVPQEPDAVGHYWTAGEWTLALQRVGIAIESWNTSLGLYPWPASALFDRSLHFVARMGAGASLRRA